jgi:hypothetical protein
MEVKIVSSPASLSLDLIYILSFSKFFQPIPIEPCHLISVEGWSADSALSSSRATIHDPNDEVRLTVSNEPKIRQRMSTTSSNYFIPSAIGRQDESRSSERPGFNFHK